MAKKITKAQQDLLADIGGNQEIAAALGVSKGLLSVWQGRHADFPTPVLVLSAGRFYRISEVLEWARGREQ